MTKRSFTPDEVQAMLRTEADLTQFCRMVYGRAVELMVEHGASFELSLDTMMTYTTAQIVATYGRAAAVEMLEIGISEIESGRLDGFEGRGRADIH